mmetsp:Transcript_64707/g.204286  ORF Transcript_64707/g.204286 Transcript_64707/m.204286 type:complete len:202 (+) Transcript_64707:829-1434(+)
MQSIHDVGCPPVAVLRPHDVHLDAEGGGGQGAKVVRRAIVSVHRRRPLQVEGPREGAARAAPRRHQVAPEPLHQPGREAERLECRVEGFTRGYRHGHVLEHLEHAGHVVVAGLHHRAWVGVKDPEALGGVRPLVHRGRLHAVLQRHLAPERVADHNPRRAPRHQRVQEVEHVLRANLQTRIPLGRWRLPMVTQVHQDSSPP